MPLSKIVANSITDNTITTDQIAGNSVHGRRNLIINGAAQVSQRATSNTGVTSGGYLNVDRFKYTLSSSGTFTLSQSSVAPEGFATSIGIECTTADASPNYLFIETPLEGQDLQTLKKGTSNAESVTFSFYVRSSKTGTYQLTVRDSDNNRQIGATYTINAANTWERKIITFPGDTTGTLDNDNAKSMEMEWWLASGSTYNSGAVPTAWEAQANGDRAAGLTVNIGASTSDNFYITGIQMEVGNKATPFEHRSFADELTRCQRYYAERKNTTGASMYYGNTLQAYTTSYIYGVIADYPVPMRATPTVSQSGDFGAYTASSANNGMGTTITNLSATSHAWRTGGWSGNSNLTAGHAVVLFALSNAKLIADAEI